MVDAGEITTVLRTVSFTHPITTTETTLVEHSNLTELITHHFDFSNFSEITTIRVFERIDGVNYRQLSKKLFPDDYETGTEAVIIILDGAGQDMKITLQSATVEPGIVTIPGTVRDKIRI